MVINHDHKTYRKKWRTIGANKYNGAFYYSKEICANIIPNVRTDRNWITLNIPGVGCDHAIVFVHNNVHPDHYDWMKKYDDMVLVCGVPETCKRAEHLGTAIYLPLSVDVEYVSQFKVDKKTKGTAYVGRKNKATWGEFPNETELLCGMKRQTLLPAMAQYEKVYAVGRCAIEAKILGCEVLPYDPRVPDPSIWKIVDNKEAAFILQQLLDEIDGKE